MAKMIFITTVAAVVIISLIVFIYKRMNKYNPQREDSGTVAFLTGVFLAGMGIVAFWVFGFSDKEAQALYAFLFAGTGLLQQKPTGRCTCGLLLF